MGMELKAQLSGWLKLLSSYLMDITAPYSGSSGGKKIIKMWWSHTHKRVLRSSSSGSCLFLDRGDTQQHRFRCQQATRGWRVLRGWRWRQGYWRRFISVATDIGRRRRRLFQVLIALLNDIQLLLASLFGLFQVLFPLLFGPISTDLKRYKGNPVIPMLT